MRRLSLLLVLIVLAAVAWVPRAPDPPEPTAGGEPVAETVAPVADVIRPDPIARRRRARKSDSEPQPEQDATIAPEPREVATRWILRGRVVDETGRAIRTGSLRVVVSHSYCGNARAGSETFSAPIENGNYAVDLTAAQTPVATITSADVTAPGFATTGIAHRELLGPPDERELPELRLRPVALVTGRVTAAGQPATWMRVQAIPTGDPGDRPTLVSEIDEDGRFRIEIPTPNRPWLVTVRRRGSDVHRVEPVSLDGRLSLGATLALDLETEQPDAANAGPHPFSVDR